MPRTYGEIVGNKKPTTFEVTAYSPRHPYDDTIRKAMLAEVEARFEHWSTNTCHVQSYKQGCMLNLFFPVWDDQMPEDKRRIVSFLMKLLKWDDYPLFITSALTDRKGKVHLEDLFGQPLPVIELKEFSIWDADNIRFMHKLNEVMSMIGYQHMDLVMGLPLFNQLIADVYIAGTA